MMTKGFRQSDVRRLEEIFNHDLPAPYAAEGELTNKYQCLHIRVIDPEAPELSVCNVRFDYVQDEKGLQPPILEVDRIAAEFVSLCREYELTRDQRAVEAVTLGRLRDARAKARAAAVAPPKAPPPPERGLETEEKTELDA